MAQASARNEAWGPWRPLIKQGTELWAPQVRWASLCWGGGQARASVEAVGVLGGRALAVEAWLGSVMSKHSGGYASRAWRMWFDEGL